MDLTSLFYQIDNFVISLSSTETLKIIKGRAKKGCGPRMHLSEIMTILVAYHSSNFKNFKSFYMYLLTTNYFPRMLSYTRLVEWIPYTLIPLCAYLKSNLGKVTGISFIDSTSISVCKNIRIKRNKVFSGIATRGKSSMGWFYGFKLHIIVSEVGELLAFKLTQGKTNDRVPVKELCKNIKGKLFGDKGYLGQQLFEELFAKGVHLITNIKSNMKNKLISLEDKLMLRKRFLIETINDQLKNISNLEHSRHRSPMNFLVNIIAGLISYTHQPKKPSIKWNIGPISLSN